MKAVVAAFNQEKALVGAFSVITNLRMELFQALAPNLIFLVPGASVSFLLQLASSPLPPACFYSTTGNIKCRGSKKAADMIVRDS